MFPNTSLFQALSLAFTNFNFSENLFSGLALMLVVQASLTTSMKEGFFVQALTNLKDDPTPPCGPMCTTKGVWSEQCLDRCVTSVENKLLHWMLYRTLSILSKILCFPSLLFVQVNFWPEKPPSMSPS